MWAWRPVEMPGASYGIHEGMGIPGILDAVEYGAENFQQYKASAASSGVVASTELPNVAVGE